MIYNIMSVYSSDLEYIEIPKYFKQTFQNLKGTEPIDISCV